MEKHIEIIEDFLKNNDWVQKDSEFESIMYEVSDSLKAQNAGIEAVSPILNLMERHPLVSFGSPGGLVHFIEGFYGKGYEELLEESVSKKPTVHTIWLLNRLINGSLDKKAMEYIQIMKSIYANQSLHDEIRKAARDNVKIRR